MFVKERIAFGDDSHITSGEFLFQLCDLRFRLLAGAVFRSRAL